MPDIKEQTTEPASTPNAFQPKEGPAPTEAHHLKGGEIVKGDAAAIRAEALFKGMAVTGAGIVFTPVSGTVGFTASFILFMMGIIAAGVLPEDFNKKFQEFNKKLKDNNWNYVVTKPFAVVWDQLTDKGIEAVSGKYHDIKHTLPEIKDPVKEKSMQENLKKIEADSNDAESLDGRTVQAEAQSSDGDKSGGRN
ncbi:MAG: hypothetical protein ACI9TO_001019 [Rickettsiales bacterium]|jgi:hypothetical protein